jgi:hypothetical protein
MKKTVQIVTIPLNKEGWGKGDICSHTLTSIDKKYLIAANDNPDGENGRAQQLLVLSDDEIQEGDICHDYCDAGQPPYKHLIGKCLSVDKTNGWIEFEDYKTGLGWCKKIIASYPQLPGTLPISKETVQAWIDAGTPGEGSVEIGDTIYCSVVKGKVKYGDPTKLDPQGNLLLEFGKKVCSEKEILKKLRYAETPELKDSFLQELSHDIREKQSKPSVPTDEEILKKSLEHSNNLYNSDDKCKDNILSEHQLWENCLRDYEAGYKQALKDLGHE